MNANHIARIAAKNPQAAVAALQRLPFSAVVAFVRRQGFDVADQGNRREFWRGLVESLSGEGACFAG